MLLNKSIRELRRLFDLNEITSVELVKEAYEQIERHNGLLGAFIALREKAEALCEAEELDKKPVASRGPLHGIPFSMKDVFVTKDVHTTAGSKMLHGFSSPFESTVAKRLRDAGAILIGKNSMDAWGHGGSTENTDYAIAKNPWDINRIPGGSSGGGAIAVATRMVAFAIGEDTGGSIRNPASMCNISGMKVTYGRVSRYGTIAYASSLDTVGPMTKCAEDAAEVLEVIAGHDHKDATSSKRVALRYGKLIDKPLSFLRIGIPSVFLAEEVEAPIRDIFKEAVKTFESLGASVVRVEIPSLSYAIPMYYLIAMSETCSNLARFDGIRFGANRSNFSPETVRRILVGTHALKAGYHDELYKRSVRGRTMLIKEFDVLWKHCDVVLGPTLPSLPHKHGEIAKDPMIMFLADSFTVPVNLTGCPALALPAGFTGTGLPVGIQLIGKKFDEETLLGLGHAYQKKTDWHTKIPSLVAHKKR